MAGSLPQAGVSLVAQGVAGFLGDMGRANKSVLGFGDAARSAGGGVSAFGQVAIGALREVGALATQALAEAGRAMAGFVAGSISTAGDFEQTLNVLGATSGATAEDLSRVAERAKELGADLTLPATSATDAANVMLELSKAGFSVQESMDAAKGALQLATAAQTDAATAAGIVSGAINAFNLEATEAVRIADLLAAGANASSASMTDLGQGLQQAGFAFAAAGLPVEDLVTSLAALTNVGLTGSDAGTALKNALMRLMDPTAQAASLMRDLGFSAYDANGQMKPLPVLISDLNASLAGMTDEERNAALGTIFLSDGMKAMIPLLELGEDGFYKLKDAVTEEGAAADVAAAQTQGWNGAIASVQSQLETLQLTIGQALLPLLTPLALKVAELIGSFTGLAETFISMIPSIMSAADPFRSLMAALVILNPTLIGVTGLLLGVADVVQPIVAAFLDAGPASSEFGEALSLLLGPLGATQGAIFAGQTALIQIGAALQSVAGTLTGVFNGSVGSTQQVLGSLVNTFLGVVLPALAVAATWFAANLPVAIAAGQAAFQQVGAFIGSLMPQIQGIITSTLTIVQAFWERHGATILQITQSVWQAIQGVIQVVFGVIQGLLAVFAAAMTGDYTAMGAQLQQANTTIWTGISNFLSGILNTIAAFFGTSLSGIKATWESNFRAFGQIAETLMGMAQRTITGAISAISGAFDSVVRAINGAIAAVRAFISAASQIKVPDLITPGSPTPLEKGMWGIDKATGAVARTFSAAFSPALASVPAMPTMTGSTTNYYQTTGPSYQMPIYTNQSPAVLQQSVAVMEAMAAR